MAAHDRRRAKRHGPSKRVISCMSSALSLYSACCRSYTGHIPLARAGAAAAGRERGEEQYSASRMHLFATGRSRILFAAASLSRQVARITYDIPADMPGVISQPEWRSAVTSSKSASTVDLQDKK